MHDDGTPFPLDPRAVLPFGGDATADATDAVATEPEPEAIAPSPFTRVDPSGSIPAI